MRDSKHRLSPLEHEYPDPKPVDWATLTSTTFSKNINTRNKISPSHANTVKEARTIPPVILNRHSPLQKKALQQQFNPALPGNSELPFATMVDAAPKRCSITEWYPGTAFVLAEVVRPIVGKHSDTGKRVLLDVLQRGPHLHHKHGGLHFWRCGQVLQDEVVILRQPKVYSSHRLIVEGPNAHHS